MLTMNEIGKPMRSAAPMTILRVANIERAQMLVESLVGRAIDVDPTLL